MPAIDMATTAKKLEDSHATSINASTSIFSVLRWHLYTIFLFTASDFKTTVIPNTILGTFNALSGSVLLMKDPQSPAYVILARAPIVFFWVWINLLAFNLNNQRRPEAILEDGINKPWRPMPLKRLSSEEAFKAMLLAYAAAFGVSWYLRAIMPWFVLALLSFSYNDLGGADASCIVKNLHNGGFYLSGATRATIVACGGNELSNVAWTWLSMLGITVFLTVHMQDMPDQEGDRLRGRNSVPLVIGDTMARWTIAVTMTVCSFLLPGFWKLGPLGFMTILAIGAIVILRVLSKRSVGEDEVTWKIWNLWLSSIYLLPFIASLGANSQSTGSSI